MCSNHSAHSNKYRRLQSRSKNCSSPTMAIGIVYMAFTQKLGIQAVVKFERKCIADHSDPRCELSKILLLGCIRKNIRKTARRLQYKMIELYKLNHWKMSFIAELLANFTVELDERKFQLLLIFKVASNGPIGNSARSILNLGVFGQLCSTITKRAKYVYLKFLVFRILFLLNQIELHIHSDCIYSLESYDTNKIQVPPEFMPIKNLQT